jgi:hypothetical protein
MPEYSAASGGRSNGAGTGASGSADENSEKGARKLHRGVEIRGRRVEGHVLRESGGEVMRRIGVLVVYEKLKK